jgi:ureidoglycolate amidohydrolase
MLTTQVKLDESRLMHEIETLATYSDAPAPAVTRILYTPTDLAARHAVQEWVDAAGFQWRTDAIGNHFIRWEGSDLNAVPVATGSHIDAIPYSGKYDGVVGVLGGLEALRSLRAHGFRPRRSLEVILFTAEEPTRFGVGCIGSRALSGAIDADGLRALHDADGNSFETLRHAAGFQGALEEVAISPNSYHAFVELHIEQGPILEIEKIPLGIVTSIAASARMQVTFVGDGGHAGTVPMNKRRDPLPAAAELALFAEAIARDNVSPHAVATVGKFDVHPNASNGIPMRVRMSFDVRDGDETNRNVMVQRIREQAADIATQRNLEQEFILLNADGSLQCAPMIVDAAERAAVKMELPHIPLVSRAYHDTVFMGRICPVGMLFIPCYKGYSHRPEEHVEPVALINGVTVLALTLAELAGGAWR